MKKPRVLTLVGTRPELIKLARVIPAMDAATDHVLAHTGQNFDWELNGIFFEDLGIRKPDHFLNCAKETVAETIGSVIVESDKLMESIKPDAILLYGDTNSCLSVIPAKRRKIPIFHMESGNRSFDSRVPEELNRKIVDHLSDINMPLTEHGRRYLLREGIRPETIFVTGSCMKEVLHHQWAKIQKSDVLQKLKLEKEKYFVVSSHREENVDSESQLRALIESLNALVDTYNYPILFSVHPRTRKRLDALKNLSINSKIIQAKPLGFSDYVSLQINATCTLSDSGTIMEEASLLGIPAISLRASHERPEGIDAGVLIVSPLEKNSILNSVDVAIKQPRGQNVRKQVSDYEVENVSGKVVNTVLSYIEFVNRTVWFKHT
jgi:UDP-N-acetylglucosamine 2-epimerase (non-hydrolysing)